MKIIGFMIVALFALTGCGENSSSTKTTEDQKYVLAKEITLEVADSQGEVVVNVSKEEQQKYNFLAVVTCRKDSVAYSGINKGDPATNDTVVKFELVSKTYHDMVFDIYEESSFEKETLETKYTYFPDKVGDFALFILTKEKNDKEIVKYKNSLFWCEDINQAVLEQSNS